MQSWLVDPVHKWTAYYSTLGLIELPCEFVCTMKLSRLQLQCIYVADGAVLCRFGSNKIHAVHVQAVQLAGFSPYTRKKPSLTKWSPEPCRLSDSTSPYTSAPLQQ